MKQAEAVEEELSYCSPCGSESARKQLGSYYTPSDVALFFWAEFLSFNRVDDRETLSTFWKQHHFIEPSAGSGALIWALLKKGGDLGLGLHQLAAIEMTVVDVNSAALSFIKEQLSWLENRWEIVFSNIRFICCDFRKCNLPDSTMNLVFFGNPPFVSNPKNSKWKNLFADFLERAFDQSGCRGQCHFILPVSIAFSRDYTRLRQQLRLSGKSIALSSFDNIPDTLFKSGKPAHTNTNKANSQRCSILTVFPDSSPRILSTQMHRWSRKERQLILSEPAYYHDVTDYSLDDQFPRPENAAILRYLKSTKQAPRFKTLLSASGPHCLFVASVARNFIGFREDSSSSVHCLRFDTKKAFYSALLILSSGIFLDYWRTVGDGFHLTQKNIQDFPLHELLMKSIESKMSKGRRMWEQRMDFAKTKRHPGGSTISYDFGSVALSFRDIF